MYKLVAIDLDGTLLNSSGEVSNNTKNAIKQAIDNGIEVVLASGRTIESFENFALELGAKNYLISGNGSAVYDIQNKEIIYSNFLSKEQVLKIAKVFSWAGVGESWLPFLGFCGILEGEILEWRNLR